MLGLGYSGMFGGLQCGRDGSCVGSMFVYKCGLFASCWDFDDCAVQIDWKKSSGRFSVWVYDIRCMKFASTKIQPSLVSTRICESAQRCVGLCRKSPRHVCGLRRVEKCLLVLRGLHVLQMSSCASAWTRMTLRRLNRALCRHLTQHCIRYDSGR